MQKSEHVFRGRFLQSRASLGIALFLGIGLAIALDPKGPPYLGGFVGTAGAYLSWILGWQSSVRLRPDGVEVDNMFLASFVPWDAFREFRVANGLQIVTSDGRAIGSFSFGGSVAGNLTGYRAMRRVAERMEAERRTLLARRSGPGKQPTIVRPTATAGSRRLRVHVGVWPLLAFAVPLEVIGVLTSSLR